MNGSAKLLLGSLVVGALVASSPASAHGSGGPGSMMKGQGAVECDAAQTGMQMRKGQDDDMPMYRGRGHAGTGGMMMHRGLSDDEGHGASGMMGSGRMGGAHMGSGYHMGGGKMARGLRVTPVEHLTVEDVSHFFGHILERRGNKRLKLGEVKQRDEDTITAQIVTVDGSLVQEFEVDRHSGWAKRAN